MKKSLVLALLVASSGAFAASSIDKLWRSATADRPVIVQHSGEIEVAFSPDGAAESLVVKVINSAQRSLVLAGYSFTSKPIAEAMVAAHRRGVDVKAVLDKSQLTEKYSGANFLVNAGVPTRIDSRYAIFHHKFIVVDGETVQQGSFNYTTSAQQRNAENVMVVWRNRQLAATFTQKWERYWQESSPVGARY